MKKILLFLFLLNVLMFAQIKTVTMGSGGIGTDAYQDTLKPGKKTIVVNMTSTGTFKNWILTVFTTSGVDTITVETKSRKGNFYSYKSIVDLTTGIVQTGTLTITTTVKEYAINDPQITSVRLTTADVITNAVFVLSGKNDGSIIGIAATATGVATAANQAAQIDYARPFTISTGKLTTVSTEVDTTIFTSTKWQTFGVFALNDSLEISLSGTFADAKLVLPYTEYTFEKFSPTTFPKGYVRRYGTIGTVDYIPTIIGY
jgi:hypothetical protein